jgi:hypothetical protein
MAEALIISPVVDECAGARERERERERDVGHFGGWQNLEATKCPQAGNECPSRHL